MEQVKVSNRVEVTDLSLAGYFQMKGVKLVKAQRRDRDFLFIFDDGKGVIPELEIEWTNSECALYDAAIRRIKHLCFKDKRAVSR